MKIAEIMSQPVVSIEPTRSIADAAHLMAELDIGALPIEAEGKLIGIVTDRDIAVRGVAGGLHHGAPVLRIMTDKVATCGEDDEVQEMLGVMARQQVRRLPVCSEEGALIGMISLGDVARRDPGRGDVSTTLGEVCLPRGRHSQTLNAA